MAIKLTRTQLYTNICYQGMKCYYSINISYQIKNDMSLTNTCIYYRKDSVHGSGITNADVLLRATRKDHPASQKKLETCAR